MLFAPRLPAEYAVWLGEIKPLSYYKERYMVDSVFYTDEVVTVLHNQNQGVGQPLLFLLHGLNTDSNNFSKPEQFVANWCMHFKSSTKSKYGGHVSTIVESVNHSRLLLCNVDVGELENLRSKKNKLEEEISILDSSLKLLQSEQRHFEDEAAQLHRQREDILNIAQHEKKKCRELDNRAEIAYRGNFSSKLSPARLVKRFILWM